LRSVCDLSCLVGEHLGDHFQPGAVGVVQRDPGDATWPPVIQQNAVHQGDAEAAAAEDRQLHQTTTTEPPAWRHRSRLDALTCNQRTSS
jgi:hypothetical protein